MKWSGVEIYATASSLLTDRLLIFEPCWPLLTSPRRAAPLAASLELCAANRLHCLFTLFQESELKISVAAIKPKIRRFDLVFFARARSRISRLHATSFRVVVR